METMTACFNYHLQYINRISHGVNLHETAANRVSKKFWGKYVTKTYLRLLYVHE